jgi:hypothetical protein
MRMYSRIDYSYDNQVLYLWQPDNCLLLLIQVFYCYYHDIPWSISFFASLYGLTHSSLLLMVFAFLWLYFYHSFCFLPSFYMCILFLVFVYLIFLYFGPTFIELQSRLLIRWMLGVVLILGPITSNYMAGVCCTKLVANS